MPKVNIDESQPYDSTSDEIMTETVPAHESIIINDQNFDEYKKRLEDDLNKKVEANLINELQKNQILENFKKGLRSDELAVYFK